MLLLLAAATATAQERGFVVSGTLDMPDGTAVGIVCETDTAYSVEMASGTVKDRHFELRGKVDKPLKGTFMTNNLELKERNDWPDDSIKWTYTDIFLSNDDITISPDLTISGGMVQRDFNDLQQMGGAEGDSAWQFIDAHPHSSVAAWLANRMLQRGYQLTADEVEHLASTIDVPTDPLRMEEFGKRIDYARKTTKGSPLVDIALTDVNGNQCRLTEVVPHGKMVLIDFWASWCGICIYSMPKVKALAETYADKLAVIAVSIDTKEKNWRMAMEKHPEPWPQYMTTAQGYKDFFSKYQVGNGVPYYLLVSPDGKVIASPDGPEEAELFLNAED